MESSIERNRRLIAEDKARKAQRDRECETSRQSRERWEIGLLVLLIGLVGGMVGILAAGAHGLLAGSGLLVMFLLAGVVARVLWSIEGDWPHV